MEQKIFKCLFCDKENWTLKHITSKNIMSGTDKDNQFYCYVFEQVFRFTEKGSECVGNVWKQYLTIPKEGYYCHDCKGYIGESLADIIPFTKPEFRNIIKGEKI